jgi:predicted nucleic acid-binding Zn ribbon protein
VREKDDLYWEGNMTKTFRLLYFANAAIIVLGLLSPLFAKYIRGEDNDASLMQWYAVAIVLSVTVCIPFLGLNVYGAVRYRRDRMKFSAVAILLSAWVFWGVYQFVYAYIHDIVW